MMKSIRAMRIASFGVATLISAGVPYMSVAADDAITQKLQAWDKDHDGTLDLAEVKAAAAAKFASLDADNDGTLDKKEAAAGHISASAFAKADTDKDGTIDKAEYLQLVTERFKAADPDNDGTVSADELNTKAGAALIALLK
jgi:Ca2+-binding EF-hand superfamily protein